jgi:hypothetical protein
MIREVCSVDAGKRRLHTHPHLEKWSAECSWKRRKNI